LPVSHKGVRVAVIDERVRGRKNGGLVIGVAFGVSADGVQAKFNH